LGVGGGFDGASTGRRSSSGEFESCSTSSESQCDGLSSTLRPTPPVSLAARPLTSSKTPSSTPAFHSLPQTPHPPNTAMNYSFNISQPPLRSLKSKRRPAPLGFLSPVPSSPMTSRTPSSGQPITPRNRTQSQKPPSPSPHIRRFRKDNLHTVTMQLSSALSTPSQTLFVFPPDLTPTTRTPSTMTLTSNITNVFPFPIASTPHIATTRLHGRTKSFIGIPPTPTTACSRVDARGWIGVS